MNTIDLCLIKMTSFLKEKDLTLINKITVSASVEFFSVPKFCNFTILDNG